MNGYKTTNLLALILLSAAAARASEIRPAGVIGNSGAEGPTLLRAGAAEVDGGVYLDPDLTLWFSGGDRILNTTFDGRLIRAYPLPPACKAIWGHCFAALDGVLYFGGRGDKLTAGPMPSWGALFALPMKPGGTVRSVCGLDGVQGPDTMALCPVPVGRELLLGRQMPADGGTAAGVFFLDPLTKNFRPFKVFPGQRDRPGVPPVAVKSVAFDPKRKTVFIGGYFGKRNVGRLHSPYVHEFAEFDLHGQETGRHDTVYLGTAVDPRGWLCIAGGVAWLTAWHGHVMRMDRDFSPAPGVVASWNFELNTPKQLVGVRDVGAPCIQAPASGSQASAYDPLVIATARPFVYFARWNRRESRLELVRRVGSLPSVASVNLSCDGWVSVGVGPSDQSWWRWEDGPDVPPRFANLAVGASGGAFDDRDRLCCLAPSPYAKTWTTGVFSPITATHSADVDPDNLVPFQPGGFGIRQGTKVLGSGANAREVKVAVAYATNRDDRGVWACPLDVQNWKVAGSDRWKKLPTTGVAFRDPGDVAVLDGGALAVVDGGEVIFLREAGEKLELVGRLGRWGDAPGQCFGKEVHVAADGPNLVVADTQRHRVLWFGAESRRLKGQLGATDRPGTGLGVFDRPTCLGISGNRIAVSDAGNQRIIKAVLSE